VFRYRLHAVDGDDLGEATYAVGIKAGDEIHVGNGGRLRVIDVVPFEDGTTRWWGCWRSRRRSSPAIPLSAQTC
jgi:hypothetical protein